MITPAGSVGAPVWPPASCRVNHASAVPIDARRRAAARTLSQASDRRRRREEATAGAVGLLAAPVLAVAAHLDFPERDGLVQLVQEVTPGRFLHVAAREFDAVSHTTAMRTIDRADEMPVGDPVGVSPSIVSQRAGRHHQNSDAEQGEHPHRFILQTAASGGLAPPCVLVWIPTVD